MTRLYLAVLLCLGLCCRPAAAQTTKPSTEQIRQLVQQLGEHYYGAFVHEKKIGWIREQFQWRRTGNQPVVISTLQIHMAAKAMGNTTYMDNIEQRVFSATPPYPMLSYQRLETSVQTHQRLNITRNNNQYIAHIVNGNQARTRTLDNLDITLTDYLADRIWILQQPKPGQTITCKTYDFDDLQADTELYKIMNVDQPIIQGVKTTVYQINVSSKRSGDIGSAWMLTNGTLLRMTQGSVFEARLQPKAIATAPNRMVDMFNLGKITIDQPLGDPSTITGLVMTVRGKGAKYLTNGPNQQIHADPKTDIVTITTGAELPPVNATEQQISENLQPTVRYPSNDPKVKALAQKAIGETTTTVGKVERLNRFVDRFIRDQMIADPLKVHQILQQRRGDCTEHALLMTTLCRAAGIPAREVSGLIYMGDRYKTFGGHAWCEVVIDGRWVPVDPSWDETRTNGTHIRFEAGPKAQSASAKLYGSITFELKEIKR